MSAPEARRPVVSVVVPCHNAVAYLRPWLQMEELTTSMRMVARIPQKS